MATNDRQARLERARLRSYRARQEVHEHKRRRRIRDDLVAGIVAILVIAAAVTAQLLYFGTGPGAPAPTTPAPTAPASDAPTAPATEPAPETSAPPAG